MKLVRWTLLILLVFITMGCTVRQYIYEVPELRKLLETRLSTEEICGLKIPFEPSEEMLVFAKSAVGYEISSIDKSIKLVDAIMSKWALDIGYERTADYTAQELFYTSHKANCLAFTHLFISLARSINIRAHYVDVKFEEQIRENGILVSNHHICAGIYDGIEFFLIDFDPNPQKKYRCYRLIDDIEALVNHYNNIAMNHYSIRSDKIHEALRILNITLKIKPDFTRALNNKGVILSRLGNPDEAEASFRRVIEIDPKMPEANSNLAGILLEKGNSLEAIKHAKTAVKQKPRNTQYRLGLGIAYLHQGNYELAFKEFRIVTKQRKNQFRKTTSTYLPQEIPELPELPYNPYQQQ
ncbi:tetratricopeptide repeat protein [bacterium]|nr:tetratricopeptide repeat protein [bacterium]